jgi:hypothetical protein
MKNNIGAKRRALSQGREFVGYAIYSEERVVIAGLYCDNSMLL